MTSWQVADALKGVEFLSGELGEVAAEGTLAPESYEVTPGDDRAALVARMEELQTGRLAAAWEGRAADLPIGTPEEALILASIIEKETGIPEERDRVASVFVNRLRQGMRLQTDPTVIYGLTKGQGVLGRGLRRSELDGATPWNTYVIVGLPPTPIANPGLASLQAAVNPAETELLFFVADGSGGHAFATASRSTTPTSPVGASSRRRTQGSAADRRRLRGDGLVTRAAQSSGSPRDRACPPHRRRLSRAMVDGPGRVKGKPLKAVADATL